MNMVSYPLDGRDLAKVTDRELFDLYHSAPVLFSHGVNRSVRLSSTLVLKGNVLTSEGENMKFAAAHMRILMPQCHRMFYFRSDRQIQHRRFFRDVWITNWLAHYLHHNPFRRVSRNEIGGNEQFEKNDDSEIDDNNESNEGGSDEFKSEGGWFIVMDYVPGRTLEECWNDLNAEAREKVTADAARMIEEMQSVPFNNLPPGPIGGQTPFTGSWFSDHGAGPFATV
jgi:hypothetical protein